MRFRTKPIVVVCCLAATCVAAVIVSLSARAAARRQQCANNLRLIGLGLWNYHDSFRSFPPGSQGPTLPLEKRTSWCLSAMPYMFCMHCNGMETDYDLGRPWDDAAHRRLARTPVYVFECPAHPDRSPGTRLGCAGVGDVDGPLAPTHYIGMAGVGVDAPNLPKEDARAGVFGFERATSVKDIMDGTANTIMVMETAQANGPWIVAGSSTVRGLDQRSQPYVGRDRQFGGLHGSGALTLFADGCVRYVSEEVQPGVLEALVTIHGGEQVDPETLKCYRP